MPPLVGWCELTTKGIDCLFQVRHTLIAKARMLVEVLPEVCPGAVVEGEKPFQRGQQFSVRHQCVEGEDEKHESGCTQ